jgi:glycosyltransferase involved in cell wall biosynthesis
VSVKAVTVISHDLTGNALSRAYVLAKLLQPEYRVRVVGQAPTDDVWAPVRSDTSIEYRRFYHPSAVGVWAAGPRIARRLIDGDVIVAVKPMHASLGLGLQARRLLGRPLMLDMDDWELGFLSDSVYWEARILKTRWVWETQSPLYTRLADRCIREADAVTVSSSFLQQRYGGTWLGQPRDEALFNPCRFPAKTGDGPKTVLFLGSARGHKGLHELLEAWTRVRHPRAVLRIVGTPLDDPLIQSLRPLADARVQFEGTVPFDQVPSILASADVFVLPQKAGRASVGQVPMKMIDAMALARPVVGTAVGDIPAWLADGAGVVVPPDDPAALACAVEKLLDQPAERIELGGRARARFLKYGSFAAVRPRLARLVAALIHRKPLPAPTPAFVDEDAPDTGFR